MKRSPLKRSTPLARTGGPIRRTRLKQRNGKRSAKAKARNFGDEADAVRAMSCLCNASLCNELRAMGPRANLERETAELFTRWCRGPVQAAHVTARGNGGAKGGRFDIVPLCAHHHTEAGEGRTSDRSDFEKLYGVDLRAEADRIAIGHDLPLGIRGLAHRRASGEVLSGYDRDALLGWIRRSGRVLLFDVATALSVGFATAASLLSAAKDGAAGGWPMRESLDRQLPEGWARMRSTVAEGQDEAWLSATDEGLGYCIEGVVKWDGCWQVEVFTFPGSEAPRVYAIERGSWSGALADGCEAANSELAEMLRFERELLAGGEA